MQSSTSLPVRGGHPNRARKKTEATFLMKMASVVMRFRCSPKLVMAVSSDAKSESGGWLVCRGCSCRRAPRSVRGAYRPAFHTLEPRRLFRHAGRSSTGWPGISRETNQTLGSRFGRGCPGLSSTFVVVRIVTGTRGSSTESNC